MSKLKAAWLWCWSHRTKGVGVIGGTASYAFLNQDKLGLFIPARSMGFTMGAIGAVTFGVGLYNTFLRKDKEPV